MRLDSVRECTQSFVEQGVLKKEGMYSYRLLPLRCISNQAVRYRCTKSKSCPSTRHVSVFAGTTMGIKGNILRAQKLDLGLLDRGFGCKESQNMKIEKKIAFSPDLVGVRQ